MMGLRRRCGGEGVCRGGEAGALAGTELGVWMFAGRSNEGE